MGFGALFAPARQGARKGESAGPRTYVVRNNSFLLFSKLVFLLSSFYVGMGFVFVLNVQLIMGAAGEGDFAAGHWGPSKSQQQ